MLECERTDVAVWWDSPHSYGPCCLLSNGNKQFSVNTAYRSCFQIVFVLCSALWKFIAGSHASRLNKQQSVKMKSLNKLTDEGCKQDIGTVWTRTGSVSQSRGAYVLRTGRDTWIRRARATWLDQVRNVDRDHCSHGDVFGWWWWWWLYDKGDGLRVLCDSKFKISSLSTA
jgi:hypothetical protein